MLPSSIAIVKCDWSWCSAYGEMGMATREVIPLSVERVAESE